MKQTENDLGSDKESKDADKEAQADLGIVWSAWAMTMVNIRSRLEGIEGSKTADDEQSLKTAPKANDQKSIFASELAFDQLPRPTIGDKPQPELGVWLLAIPSNSDQIREAKNFIRHALDLGVGEGEGHPQGFRSRKTGPHPPRKSVLENLAKLDARFQRNATLIPAIQTSLESARLRPRTACWAEIEDKLGKHLEESIIQGRPALDGVNEEVNTLFTFGGCRQHRKELGED